MNYTTYYYYVNYSMYSTGILQSKLETAGVRGSALDWLNNFLSNSIQKVRNADQFSAPIYVNAGILQKSVLSAIALNTQLIGSFLVSINDLLLLPSIMAMRALLRIILHRYCNSGCSAVNSDPLFYSSYSALVCL